LIPCHSSTTGGGFREMVQQLVACNQTSRPIQKLVHNARRCTE
jgi:hypothetical protein